MTKCLSLFSIWLISFASISAAIADEEINFAKQIAPILNTHCIECHGDKVREGGLRFTNRHDALLETDSTSFAIVPFKPAESTILDRVLSTDESDQMPPDGDRLTKSEIATLKQWIAEGAIWPETETKKHWAYIAPDATELPKVKNKSWPKNEIDFFVLQQLEELGLEPSPPAEPARLLRRTSLALTGLPPSVKQVDEFLADPSEEAFEAFVDQCLESKRYGERWAQPWLDLARYADSNGFQADQIRESWAYRDWVINAMNADMPFDQFAVEQLAGDLLPDATPEQKIATGFHRTVTCNVEAGVHPEQNRVNQIFDRVNTTGTVFLGTTIECCQCHNHKYDPFTQDEYYELFAFFNNTPVEVELQSGVQYNFYGPKMDLPLDETGKAKVERLRAKVAELKSEEKELAKASRKNAKLLKKKILALENQSVEWLPLSVTSSNGSGKETFTVLDDQSVLVGGAAPAKTVYTLEATTDLDAITAIRLEALTHESLPGKGPGRGDKVRTNFILSEFSVFRKEATGDSDAFSPVALANAIADFSQKGWEVTGSLDGDRKTGWAIAPKFSKDHYAIFELQQPLKKLSDVDVLKFVLDQNYGRSRTLGRVRFSVTTADPLAFSVPDEICEIVKLEKPDKKQAKKLTEFFEASDPELARVRKELERSTKELKAVQPPSTLVMVEMEEPRDTFKMKRGDYLSPGKKLAPAVPRVLHPMDDSLPKNRLGLAKWITDPANPLIGRVTVNRWWTNLFGNGLVASGEDFGTQSDAPTHPELLDWLANEFVENGWSRKHIHKLIVMSSTFRQSANLNAGLLEIDPKNLKYTRGPRFRMSAETIRDNALAVSGLLSDKMGGAPVMPFQPDNIWRSVGRNAPKWKAATNEDRFRRGVYVIWRRAAPYPSFVNFDAPDRAACVVNRPRTNTPLQALTLLNDRAYMEMAVALAKKIDAAAPKANARKRIEMMLRECLLRTPKDSELDTLESFFRTEFSRLKKDLITANKLINENSATSEKHPRPARLAAMSLVANVLLNLDETINY